MPTSSRPWFAVAVAVALLAQAGSARAESDKEKAARLFREGRAAMAAGAPAEAFPKFFESQRLDPGAGTLLNIALCLEALGKTATAARVFEKVAQEVPPGNPRRGFAEEHKRALEKKVPTLTIAVSTPAGIEASVERDGAHLGPGDIGVAVPLDPGEHVVTASARGRPTQAHRVALVPGDSKTISIIFDVAPAVPGAPAAAPDHGGGWDVRRKLGFAAILVGGASLAASFVTGALVLQKKSEVEKNCHGTDVCDSTKGIDAATNGSTLSAASTATFVAGLAVAGGGVVLFATGSSDGGRAGVTARWHF